MYGYSLLLIRYTKFLWLTEDISGGSKNLTVCSRNLIAILIHGPFIKAVEISYNRTVAGYALINGDQSW